MLNAGLSLSIKKTELTNDAIETFVFKLNFRDRTSILILSVGISASGIVVIVIAIVYAKRRKIILWRSELIFCLNYPSCQAHWFCIYKQTTFIIHGKILNLSELCRCSYALIYKII